MTIDIGNRLLVGVYHLEAASSFSTDQGGGIRLIRRRLQERSERYEAAKPPATATDREIRPCFRRSPDYGFQPQGRFGSDSAFLCENLGKLKARQL